MSFTYSLDLTDSISQLRLEIGDTSPEKGMGVKPGGDYYHDGELSYFLTKEGNSVGCAAAAVCEALAVAWSKVASTSVGPLSEQQDTIAAKYAAQGRALRDQYGYGNAAALGSTGLQVGVLNLGFMSDDSSGDEYA